MGEIETGFGSGHKRNAGVDLLRCVMMYLIVLHHCCCHTPFSLVEVVGTVFLFTVPAVDGFIAVSGWFGMRFTIRKALVLLGQIVFYSAIWNGLAFCLLKAGVLARPFYSAGAGWFSQCYLMLFCISPFVDIRDDGNRSQGLLLFVVLFGCVCCNWFLMASGLGGVPGMGSHTFAGLLLVYCIMRLVSALVRSCGGVNVLALCGIGSVLAAYFVVAPMLFLPVKDNLIEVFRWNGYDAPLVILCALGAVVLFSRMKVPPALARVVAWATPSVFPVYLLHDAHILGRELFVFRPLCAARESFQPGDGVLSVLVVVVWAAIVFISCVMIDVLIRRFPLYLLRRLRETGSEGTVGRNPA